MARRITEPKRPMMQSVWITLSDGSRHGFLGKATCFEGDTRTILEIKFSEPKELPPGLRTRNCR